MADFTGTQADDNFQATAAQDTFYFGENEGTDLIVDFDPANDKLAYTDRSVDGFDDLDITRLSNGDAAVESNDQITVLHGIDPYDLNDANFVFTTSGPRGDLVDARDPDDINEPPEEVSSRDIDRRAAQFDSADDSGSSDGGTSSGGVHGHGGGLSGLLGSLFGGNHAALSDMFGGRTASSSAQDHGRGDNALSHFADAFLHHHTDHHLFG